MTESNPSEHGDDDLRDARDESRPSDRADGNSGRVGDATERAEDDATSVDQVTVGHQVPGEVKDRIPDHSERDDH
jgi:hypothetical protein